MLAGGLRSISCKIILQQAAVDSPFKNYLHQLSAFVEYPGVDYADVKKSGSAQIYVHGEQHRRWWMTRRIVEAGCLLPSGSQEIVQLRLLEPGRFFIEVAVND